jgi:hypothetical protein
MKWKCFLFIIILIFILLKDYKNNNLINIMRAHRGGDYSSALAFK